MSEKSKLTEQLQDKGYRESFVFSQMSIPISFQIRALREKRDLTQKQLAEKAGMLQPRIVELERPKGKEPNLRTLGRLAAAFDVALIVRFAPFSELIEWAERFSPDTFEVPSFDDDPAIHDRVAASTQVEDTHLVAHDVLFRGSFQKAAKISCVSTIDVGQIALMVGSGSGKILSHDRTPYQPVKRTDRTSKGEIRDGGRAAA